MLKHKFKEFLANNRQALKILGLTGLFSIGILGLIIGVTVSNAKNTDTKPSQEALSGPSPTAEVNVQGTETEDTLGRYEVPKQPTPKPIVKTATPKPTVKPTVAPTATISPTPTPTDNPTPSPTETNNPTPVPNTPSPTTPVASSSAQIQ